MYITVNNLLKATHVVPFLLSQCLLSVYCTEGLVEICTLDVSSARLRILKSVLESKLPVGLLMFHPTGFN